jgi:hypothetical protein
MIRGLQTPLALWVATAAVEVTALVPDWSASCCCAGALGSTTQLWLALAYLEDGQFKAARALLQKVALEEPTNRLAEGALGLYRERVEGEGPAGLKQLALVVGASVLVVGLGVWWLAARRRTAAAAGVSSALGAALSGAPVAAAPLPPLAAGARTGYGGRYARTHTASQ